MAKIKYSDIITYSVTGGGSASSGGYNVTGLTSDHVLISDCFCSEADVAWTTSSGRFEFAFRKPGTTDSMSMPSGTYKFVFGVPVNS